MPPRRESPPNAPGPNSKTSSHRTTHSSVGFCRSKAVVRIGRRAETDLLWAAGHFAVPPRSFSSRRGSCFDAAELFTRQRRADRSAAAGAGDASSWQNARVDVVYAWRRRASAEKSSVVGRTSPGIGRPAEPGSLVSGRCRRSAGTVLDSAIEVRRRARIHSSPPASDLEFTLAARAASHAVRPHLATIARFRAVFATSSICREDLLDDQLAPLHTGTVALGIATSCDAAALFATSARRR